MDKQYFLFLQDFITFLSMKAIQSEQQFIFKNIIRFLKGLSDICTIWVGLAIQLTNALMDSSLELNTTPSHKIILDNPQIEGPKCRICYEQSKPLITLCQCSGTIAYVHEDCILDWITKKMENSEVVEIPKCEICRTTYSAKLKIGRKKVCPKLLMKKVRELKIQEMAASLLFLLGSILAVIMASTAVFDFFRGLLASSNSSDSTEKVSTVESSSFLIDWMKSIVFPLWFLRCAVDHGKKRLKILDQARVQIVEVTLNPKIVIKQ